MSDLPEYTIPIDCPDGYEPVAYRPPRVGEEYARVIPVGVSTAGEEFCTCRLIVRKKFDGNASELRKVTTLHLFEVEVRWAEWET